MKTKKSTLRIAITVFICLGIAIQIMAQNVIKKDNVSFLPKTIKKDLREPNSHFICFLDQPIDANSLPNKSTKEANYHADTIFNYSINNGNQKVVKAYDNEGNLLTSLKQVWIINKWGNSELNTKSYDINGNMLTDLVQLWQSNNWINYRKVIYTYDGSGNCLTTTGQQWDAGNWVNWGKSEYSYDGSGNMLSELFQEWDGVAWGNSSLDSCTYDVNGNILTLLGQMWDGMSWTYNSLETTTYDLNDKITSILYQSWDGMSWMNDGILLYSNDGNGNRITSLEQYWDAGSWVSYYKDTNTYDINNNRLFYMNWNCFDGSTWEGYSSGTFTYDANNNILTNVYQMCNMGNWKNDSKVMHNYQAGFIISDGYKWTGTAWTMGEVGFIGININDDGENINFFNAFNTVQVQVYYSSASAGIDSHLDDRSDYIQVFPNPVIDYLTIQSSEPDMKIEKVELFDLTGKVVKITLSDNRIDLSNLQNGLYFLKLSTIDGPIVIEKIIKQ